jgi:hypothetical protein
MVALPGLAFMDKVKAGFIAGFIIEEKRGFSTSTGPSSGDPAAAGG